MKASFFLHLIVVCYIHISINMNEYTALANQALVRTGVIGWDPVKYVVISKVLKDL